MRPVIHFGKAKQLSAMEKKEGGGIGYATGVLGWTRSQRVSQCQAIEFEAYPVMAMIHCLPGTFPPSNVKISVAFEMEKMIF